MKLGWIATCQMMKCIETSITQIETTMKNTSKLVKEGNLEGQCMAYLNDQIADCEKAIKELKKFWNDLVEVDFDNLSSTPPTGDNT